MASQPSAAFGPERTREYARRMARPDFRAFDADNHYYEAEDAFTRHIEPSMAKRCMQ